MSTDTDTGKEAFDAYAEIALRYAASARSLPAQIDITPTRTLICFEVLGVALALFIEEMQELLEVPGCTRLPRVRPWVKGVANVRGKLVPVVDFARFLGGNLTAPPRQQRVLLVERKGVAAGLGRCAGHETLPGGCLFQCQRRASRSACRLCARQLQCRRSHLVSVQARSARGRQWFSGGGRLMTDSRDAAIQGGGARPVRCSTAEQAGRGENETRKN